jgi:DNA-directed RNA polymerase III subunit RPC1
MNVTLGVPRLKEIINATKKIATPIMTAPLERGAQGVVAARIIKGRLEKTTLGDISVSMTIRYKSDGVSLDITLDMARIKALQLELDIDGVRAAIVGSSKLRIREQDIFVVGRSKLCILLPTETAQPSLTAANLLRLLPPVRIHGLPGVSRAVIHAGDNASQALRLFVEGSGLRAVMGTPGVDGRLTTTNDVCETFSVLGIEAARATIISQIEDVMLKHGMTIDIRHIMLLADTMTHHGDILGITRFGIAKMKDSVLMLASFEQTAEHLFSGAVLGKKDPICGVSESIILGMQMPIGTGLFKLLHADSLLGCRPAKSASSPNWDGRFAKPLLFDNPIYHPSLQLSTS